MHILQNASKIFENFRYGSQALLYMLFLNLCKQMVATSKILLGHYAASIREFLDVISVQIGLVDNFMNCSRVPCRCNSRVLYIMISSKNTPSAVDCVFFTFPRNLEVLIF